MLTSHFEFLLAPPHFIVKRHRKFLSGVIDIFHCHFQVLNFILWYLTSPDLIKASKEGIGSIWHSWCNCWRSSEFYQDCYGIWWPGLWGGEVCMFSDTACNALLPTAFNFVQKLCSSVSHCICAKKQFYELYA
jgi:hypothetical protein